MLPRDPKIIFRNVIRSNWNADNTPLADDPRFHTGWYDYGSSDPQVTFTNTEESTVDGGDTGHTGGTGDGGVADVRAGTLLINAWAGTRDDMATAGPGGSRVNPKAASYQMAVEINRILGENADGTLHPDTGDPELNSIGGDEGRELVDTGPDNAVFRYEVQGRFTYAQEYRSSPAGGGD